MICPNEITDLKTDINQMVGQKIMVRGSLGRSKSFEKEATIKAAHPNFFVIKYDEETWNVTYTYTDVLNKIVEVNVLNGNEYSPLIPAKDEVKKRRDAIV